MRRAAVFQQAGALTERPPISHDQNLKTGRPEAAFVQGRSIFMKRKLIVALAAAAIAALVLPAQAANIIDEWASVKAPPAPALKPVTVDSKTYALLVIDMVGEACNAKARPRCVETIPAIQKLLTDARAKGMAVIYSLARTGNIVEALAPKSGEPIVTSGADKFIHTDLEKMLKDKGIGGVIVVGTLANGGVLHTAGQAALLGFKVVVPVDGMSSPNENTLYTEQYTAWHLGNAPVFSGRVTLSKVDMIKF
jgi:nicotinamidase-related amidase